MTQTQTPAHGLVPEFDFADRCIKARKVGGYARQLDLAEATGISVRTISRYEHGIAAKPSKLVLKQWALACGVSYEWLATGSPFIARGSSTRSDYTGPGRKSPGKVRAGRGAEVARLARAALAAEVEAA
jgi:transcriptional regulator with XRE-family HTH domain